MPERPSPHQIIKDAIPNPLSPKIHQLTQGLEEVFDTFPAYVDPRRVDVSVGEDGVSEVVINFETGDRVTSLSRTSREEGAVFRIVQLVKGKSHTLDSERIGAHISPWAERTIGEIREIPDSNISVKMRF